MSWRAIQRHIGASMVDGIPGDETRRLLMQKLGLAEEFDRDDFIARHVNKNADAIRQGDMADAAHRLRVSVGHIEMLRKVESGGRSFDSAGRPIILPEPHVFWRQTKGRHGRTRFSYPQWGTYPYPRSFDERWSLLADMAEVDEGAAIESASWGLWQIMGFHWKALGYENPQDFASRMVASEVEHLEALVRFIETNGLAQKLRDCTQGDPDSCRPFARAYNGSGYEKNRYHIKMSEAL